MKAIRPATITAMAACVAILMADQSAAQGTSLFGSRGPTGGNSTFGSTAAGTTTGGFTTSGAGGGSTRGFGQSTGGFGTAGGTGFGTAGATGSTLGTGQNTFGQASGLGQARQAGAFVGMGNTASTFVGNQQAAGQQAFQQFAQQFNRAGGRTNFQNGGQGGTQQQRVIRPRLRANIDYPQPSAPQITTQVQTRFRSLGTRRPDLSGLTFTLDESGTATLRGTVDTADAARLATLLARLEPGVRNIESELQVGRPDESD